MVFGVLLAALGFRLPTWRNKLLTGPPITAQLIEADGMQKILYAMHFIGRTSRTAAEVEVLRSNGSAISCMVTTVVAPSGVQTELKAATGGLAFFESELRLTGPEEFQENGEIAFGDDSGHVLRFSTIGRGHMALGLDPGVMAGTSSWKVEGGEGQFRQARGFITSNFTISDTGERNDFHCGLIFVPD
jgi:hypothetical protein